MSSPPASVFELLDVNLLTSWQLISFRKIGSVIEASRVQHLLSMSAYQLLSRNDPNIVSDAVAGRAKIIYALLDRLHLLFPQLLPPTVMHSLELLCLPNCPKGVGQFRLEMTESSLQVCRWLGGDESLTTRSTPAHTPSFYWLADANFLRFTALWSPNVVRDFVRVLTSALQHELEAPHNRCSHPADWKFIATGLSKIRGWFKSNHLPLDRDFEAVQTSILSKIASFPSNRPKPNLSNALSAPVLQSDASLLSLPSAAHIVVRAVQRSGAIQCNHPGSAVLSGSSRSSLTKSVASSGPAKPEFKSLPPFRSSSLGKRTRLDDSSSLGARNAVADLEAEYGAPSVRKTFQVPDP